ncbi:hypothetical protein MTBBW1_230004 [Desulfamplus magnetovallimortis]|uniref:Uncharacterized protein n=1 Tax=Desulfamplus magnetovallimortis TaxID=1246637 RepID=A0A1W1HDG8_9BACT|nr:hypothetical protein MTBBW1_230004 [Desulfamplus magnetovallimortis]
MIDYASITPNIKMIVIFTVNEASLFVVKKLFGTPLLIYGRMCLENPATKL